MWFRKRENDIEMSGMMEEPKNKKKEPVDLTDTEYQPFNWKRFFLAPKYIPWHILFIIIGILTVIITLKHDEVVKHLRPWAEKARELPVGWLIPIVILFIISFPPLFGHEIVALLCGVVWGLWIGFAIVAAGTFLGELGTWFAFKSLFREKAHKLERTNINYGAMARLTRDGGFLIVLIIRLSAIPAHFSTAVFSTCDVKFWQFVVATFFSLPKQIFLVYLGVLLVREADDKVIKTVMFTIVFLITIAMGVWIWFKLRKIKKVLLEEQESRKIRKSEPVEMVPTIQAAFQSHYPASAGTQYSPVATQPPQYDRRAEEQQDEWTMVPMQPTRIV